MKIATVPVMDFADPHKVASLLNEMRSGTISEVFVPFPTQRENHELLTILNSRLSDDRYEIEKSKVQINIHFEQSELNNPAFKAVESIATPTGKEGPTLTITQGLVGGAVIGGIGGFGIATLAGLIKTTTDSSSNPFLMALGAVATGIAIGSAGGTAIALGRDVDFKFGEYGLGLTTPKQSN